MEKQEKLRKEKQAKKAEKKANKKKAAEEQKTSVHSSWLAAKKAKEEANIRKFEGKKITFDDSD